MDDERKYEELMLKAYDLTRPKPYSTVQVAGLDYEEQVLAAYRAAEPERCPEEVLPTPTQIQDFIDKRLASGKTDRTAIVLVGGPGSGKSSAKAEFIAQLKPPHVAGDFVNIDPDEIIEQLFDLQETCRPLVDELNNTTYEEAIKGGKNIVYDGTGKNFEWYAEGVIGRLKREGYTVYLVIVQNNVETVLERIEKRGGQTRRFVDPDYTREVYEKLEINIPKYLSLCGSGYVDAIFEYDNKGDRLRLLQHIPCPSAQLGGGNLHPVKIRGSRPKKSKRKSRRKSGRKSGRKSRRRTNRKSNRKSKRKPTQK